MQLQFGIDQPDSGLLLDSMVVGPDARLCAAELLSPRVEAEIAFRLAEDLAGEVTEEEVGQAVAETFLALEVIDSRYGLEGLTLMDSVADNAACARISLGAPVPGLLTALGEEHLTLSVNGTSAASGFGKAILGDPIRSLLWLTRRLSSFGAGLRAGDVVLAGAVHASLPLHAGQTLSVSSHHLPEAVLHVT
ncbi:2-keto-4-pentenoate hydratase [Streptomyces beigongshangae]|uniref:2-keto-4-pentenoate hydratase n=1 Tax=Streptomyces beigongshangae TaxID=2841597 RepID=UPI0021A568F8|nr:fumarylacetoacetate hydrolase family protein [Streptomyces sp. REN17]